jgi:hypothetical protein
MKPPKEPYRTSRCNACGALGYLMLKAGKAVLVTLDSAKGWEVIFDWRAGHNEHACNPKLIGKKPARRERPRARRPRR